MNQLNSYMRTFINKHNIKKLANKDFSLISSNCNGAFILHDLGIRFNSPFVNLWIKPFDYIKMLSDLKGYLNENMTFVKEDGINYPIGQLKDVNIYFQHYQNEKEALNKWIERKKRIDYNNLFILFTDRDGCTYEDLLNFDKLPYKNKIVFTKQPYYDIKSSFYIKGFEKEESVGNCFEYMQHRLGKKYYDQFDYISWFNES